MLRRKKTQWTKFKFHKVHIFFFIIASSVEIHFIFMYKVNEMFNENGISGIIQNCVKGQSLYIALKSGSPFSIMSCTKLATALNTIGCFVKSWRKGCFKIWKSFILLFTVSCLDIIRPCISAFCWLGKIKYRLSRYPLSANVRSPSFTKNTYACRAMLKSENSPQG